MSYLAEWGAMTIQQIKKKTGYWKKPREKFPCKRVLRNRGYEENRCFNSGEKSWQDKNR